MQHKTGPLPFLAAIGVLTAFLFLNADGYHVQLWSPWGGAEFTGEPPVVNWAHGWPACFCIRSSIYSLESGRGVSVNSFTGGHGLYSRWPIDESPVFVFSRIAAACDALIGVVLVVGVFFGTSRIADYWRIKQQMGLRSLLMLVLAISLLLAFRERIFASRYVLEVLCLAVVTFGACLALCALPLHLLFRGRTVSRLSGGAADA